MTHKSSVAHQNVRLNFLAHDGFCRCEGKKSFNYKHVEIQINNSSVTFCQAEHKISFEILLY